jgi:hypothetical protein
MTTTIKSQSNQGKSVNVHFYINQHKHLWNAIAIIYTVVAFISSVILLLLSTPIMNAIGVFLLTHSLVYLAILCSGLMADAITVFKP